MVDPTAELDLSGTVLGRYRLVRRLGAGGMGSVYLARHELIDREVAVKVLHASLASRPHARERFLREALAASKVRHPGVVEIYDVAYDDAHLYFVMELLHGRDLADVLADEGRLAWRRAGPILVEIADALAAAHAVGVVHRDVKPSNCLVVTGADGRPHVKVVDFGIAKLLVDDGASVDALTATGEVFGTLGYMAPEAAQGAGDDPRSDVYAFGVMMFQLLTGRMPFEGTVLQVVSQHLMVAPPPPRSVEPSVPPAVERIVLRALEKLPDDRFASMRQLAAALRAEAPDAPPEAPPPARAVPSSPASAPARALVPARVSAADVVDLDQRRDAPRGAPADTAYGEPRRPPGPGEPRRPDPRFLPPPDAPLELELSHPRADDGPAPARRSPVPLLLLALAVGAVGVALWLAFASDDAPRPAGDPSAEPSAGAEPAPADAPTKILLRVETTPPDAQVFVDDVLATERPIAIPRSHRYVRVRVEAEGYAPRTIQVEPRADRRLEVALDRATPRRR